MPFLLHRGWSLLRTERTLREHSLAAGFTAVPKPELHRRLAGA